MRAAIIAVVIGIVVGSVAYVRTGHCTWCPSIKCMDRGICGSGCVCLKAPGEFWGNCYAIE